MRITVRGTPPATTATLTYRCRIVICGRSLWLPFPTFDASWLLISRTASSPRAPHTSSDVRHAAGHQQVSKQQSGEYARATCSHQAQLAHISARARTTLSMSLLTHECFAHKRTTIPRPLLRALRRRKSHSVHRRTLCCSVSPCELLQCVPFMKFHCSPTNPSIAAPPWGVHNFAVFAVSDDNAGRV